MPPTTIDVRAANGSYPVVVEPGSTTRAPVALAAHGVTGRALFVSSPRVWAATGRRFRRITPTLVPDGERAKTLATVSRVYDALLALGADRGSTIVAVGGGVIGDMVGLAAATYLRGLRLVHVPTTVMAQVDSAIGGKVGVNHARGKNLIGAFYPPAFVLVDPDVLQTLSRREFRAGLYEVIKYGLIAEPVLLDLLERHLDEILTQQGDALTDIIGRCCRIKAQVVSADEHEQGLRRTLNFGHTVGPRPRIDHRLPVAASRRSGRARHAGGARPGRRAGRDARVVSPSAPRPSSPASARCPASGASRSATPWTPCRATRKW